VSWLVLGCSTPISPLPQVADEEDQPDTGTVLPDAGIHQDAGRDAGGHDASTGDAGSFDCQTYGAAPDCPSALPSTGSPCSTQIGGRCFYPGTVPERVREAQCQRAGGTVATWNVTTVRCAYACAQDLPQGGNFFSVDSSGCLNRMARSCRSGQGSTSQQGVDQLLANIANGCKVPSSTRLGVSFTAQNCADVVFYQMGPRLEPSLQQCLTSELERLRIDCDVDCALSPALR
jgi:hypothetical protein